MEGKNRIGCKACGEVLESKHVHDFVECSCKKKYIAVDGGRQCRRRIGNLAQAVELPTDELLESFIEEYGKGGKP